MSVTNAELRALIRRAEDAGAQVLVRYDERAARQECRAIIDGVRVLPTCMAPFDEIGPGWMSPIAASEVLRGAFARQARERVNAILKQAIAEC